ncbi:MAG: hypothetical protein R3F41_07165 [Gammaproteobacteria bacterium]|nr:hypothetical protein [Pseudomonadales bacterium]MCP5348697.1 hypothetical protein [Pseudomonadales bacterium]
MKKFPAVLTAAILAVSGMSGVHSQSSTDYVAPRTEWGAPDLQGVWNFASDIPMQRPERYGDRQFLTEQEAAEIEVRMAALAARAEAQPDPDANREAPPVGDSSELGYNQFWIEQAGIGKALRTSHIIYPLNGRLPPRVEGAPVQRGGGALGPDIPGERPVRYTVSGIGKDGPEDRGLSERCIVGFNSGPPFNPSMYNNNVQIVQNRDTAVILTEMIHDARIVPLYDSRAAMPALDDDLRLWSGDSRGYWDGDTLVVETRNFTDLTTSYSAFGTAYDKLLIERFTRVDYDTVNYQWTIEDPSTFTDRITAIVPMTKVAGQLYEYACHEGNYGMKNILRGERMAEQRAAESESAHLH